MTSAPQPQPPSIHDKLTAFDSIPLFMKSIPAEGTDNTAIDALQSLVYDGTPDEIAQNFKEQGNEYFKGSRYREALGFYTQGIDAQPTDSILQEALLCNRAACNLGLENFGSVLRDCSNALAINPRSSKAFYRSALALVALDRAEEAIDCCDRCLSFDESNTGVQALRERAIKAKAAKTRKEEAKLEQIQREKNTRKLLSSAFQERNLIPRPGGSENPYEPHFDPEDPTYKTLIIPVFFLYPQHAISDVIPQFVEDTSFAAHLSTMFPPGAPAPEWDKKGEYVNGQLVVYATTHRRRLLKVGKKVTLRNICEASRGKEGEPKDGLELKDGCLTFVVVPKGRVEEEWVEDFKKTDVHEKDGSSPLY